MELIEVKQKIIEIEEKFPVDEWSINGVDIWPLVRIKLYIGFFSTKSKSDTIVKKPKKKYSYRFINFITALFQYVFFISSLKKKKLIFFSAQMQRVDFKSSRFNRFFDSMIDYHKLHDDVYMLEYQYQESNFFNKKSIIHLVKYFETFKTINRRKSKLSKKQPDDIKLKDYNEFYNFIKNDELFNCLLGFFEEKTIINWAKKIESNSKFFEILYTKIAPKKIIYSGYYGLDDLYSSVLAANKLGIPTIDVQHGPLTNVHMVFTSWTKIPKEGYNTMVKEYWTWDEKSNENILEWAKHNENINAKAIGNTFVSYCSKNKYDSNNMKDYIIYSIQPLFTLDYFFSESILKLMKETSQKWVLRLHPRNYFEMKDIQSFLKLNSLEDKVFIQEFHEMGLPEAIQNSLLHITHYSGCLIEAKLMGKPTIAINDIALMVYGDYFDDDSVTYINQDDSGFQVKAIEFIEKSKESKKNKIVKVYNPLSE